MPNFIFGEFQSEITQKKSRFIATAKNINSKQDALNLIDLHKKKFHDVKHIAYAYILSQDQKKYSDDGEPQGTAGIQILKNLEQKNLFYSMIVVVRYFGGILLGTGGLSRAYFSVAQSVIEKSFLLAANYFFKVNMILSYDFFSYINHELKKYNCFTENIIYDQDIKLIFYVKQEFYSSFIDSIKNFDVKKISILSQEKILGAIYNQKFISLNNICKIDI